MLSSTTEQAWGDVAVLVQYKAFDHRSHEVVRTGVETGLHQPSNLFPAGILESNGICRDRRQTRGVVSPDHIRDLGVNSTASSRRRTRLLLA